MLEWKNYLPYIRTILDNFAEDGRNKECFGPISDETSTKYADEQEKLIAVFESLGSEQENEAIDEYLYFCIHHEIPYLYVTGELANVAKALLALLAKEEKFVDLANANTYFTHLEYQISQEYYRQFLRKLAVKNHIRLSHLSQLIEKNLMIHYQHHLEWMLVLLSKLQGTSSEEVNFELNHNHCSFGKWLHNPTIPYIVNTSHFSDIQKLHILLHELAENILEKHAQTVLNHKSMIQLLQRLDYTSLEIGNEIAIINDMFIIGEYTKDPLTDLLGRRLFEKIMMSQIEIAKATESGCALIMCDLDHFKEINDRYGHLAGDEVIKSYATLLQTTLRKSDFIFRFGGEEFLILLPSTVAQEAFVLAQKLCRQAYEEGAVYNGETIRYSVSIGVYGIDTSTLSFVNRETIQTYVQNVDAKLYLAKQRGRNRVE